MGKRKTPRDRILERLQEIADDLDGVPALYAERLALFQAGRALAEPILQRELAAAARVTETAVNKELKRPPKAPVVDA